MKKLLIALYIYIYIFLIILFYLIHKNMTIIHLLLFTYVQLIFSIFVYGIYIIKLKGTDFIIPIINLIYIIIISIATKIFNIAKIVYDNSQIYASEYVEISISNSSIMSVIILIIFSFILHFSIYNFFTKKYKR